jgi:uncharacterized protein (UPF0371 family)
MKTGFDNRKYLAEQTAAILARVAEFGTKLYLELGGKLIYDYHAARVLPGFDPNVKMELLRQLRDEADIILCIHAGDIERRKIRADFGITYDADALKLIDDLKEQGLIVTSVVITRFDGQPAATIFKNKLEHRGIGVHTHRFTRGYPTDVDTIVSDDGYGANSYIQTAKPLVVVTGPPGRGRSPGSGQRTRRYLLRHGDRAAGWKHCHRQELAADARRLQPDTQRRQETGRAARPVAPALARGD